MRDVSAYAINSGWKYYSLADACYFRRNSQRAAVVQRRILREIIHKNRDSSFGRDHYFAGITDIDDYRQQVPIREYSQFVPYIDRIYHGEHAVLTAEPVKIFEPTGGSSGGSKLIPFTDSLKRQFQQALRPWIFDIFHNFPQTRWGTAYWSLSPVCRCQTTPAGIPVGFTDDSEYLGLAGKLLAKIFAVPPMVSLAGSLANFRYLSCFHLLRSQNLTLISVWNPTFLILLLDFIQLHWENLLQDIHDGRLRLPDGEDPVAKKIRYKPWPERAAVLARCAGAVIQGKFTSLWPKLEIVSCWQDGPSRLYSDLLAQKLPETIIQGKGLIATEGIVSYPIIKANGCVPAYTSHFLEFLPIGGETTLTVDQLQVGNRYLPILTTAGGLYRYNLKDIVEVTGQYRGLPLLEFIGRDEVSDLVGEKLHQYHVHNVVHQALKQLAISEKFVLCAPEQTTTGGYYVVHLESTVELAAVVYAKLGQKIEQGFCDNYHYRYARSLNQLGPVEINIVANGKSGYLKRCGEQGRRLGAIKSTILDKRTGWKNWFDSHEQLIS